MPAQTRPLGQLVTSLPLGIVPDLRPLPGRYVSLEPLSIERHAQSLYEHSIGNDESWDYLAGGPFASREQFLNWLQSKPAERDPWFYAFVKNGTREALGMGAFMRSDKTNGVIEIGHIWMSAAMQRTRESTESIYLMMRHVFDDLGMRRLEWKCNSLNEPSCIAAERYGFTYEGTFRQHMISKGRNRDTAWYAMLDSEWPKMKTGFETWLSENNFDASGQQKAKLRLT